MKNIITTLLLCLFAFCGARAQIFQVPQCSEPSVTVYFDLSVKTLDFMFYDGDKVLPVISIPNEKTVMVYIQIRPCVAKMLNDLTKQGYKLMATESSITNTDRRTYFFQK